LDGVGRCCAAVECVRLASARGGAAGLAQLPCERRPAPPGPTLPAPSPRPSPCPRAPRPAQLLSEAQLQEAGIARLPSSLMEAMQALILDDKLKGALVNGLSMQLVSRSAASRPLPACCSPVRLRGWLAGWLAAGGGRGALVAGRAGRRAGRAAGEPAWRWLLLMPGGGCEFG
jgi:hypothetical protein